MRPRGTPWALLWSDAGGGPASREVCPLAAGVTSDAVTVWLRATEASGAAVPLKKNGGAGTNMTSSEADEAGICKDPAGLTGGTPSERVDGCDKVASLSIPARILQTLIGLKLSQVNTTDLGPLLLHNYPI